MAKNIVLSNKRKNIILITILCIYPLVGMGIDLIVPSLPSISKTLEVSSLFSKNLITIYLIGAAFGNIIISFIADTIKRKTLICFSLIVFTIASCLPIIFLNNNLLLMTRLLQGITMTSIVVIARAIFTDILCNEYLIKISPIASTMWGIGPIIGPYIGGYLLFYFGWKSCFIFFACYGFLGYCILSIMLPETNNTYTPLNVKNIKTNYIKILSNKEFIQLSLLIGFSFSTLILFNTLAPFIIQIDFRYTAIFFGHIALLMGTGFLIGTISCRKLITHFNANNTLVVVISINLIIATLGIVLYYIVGKQIIILTLSSFFMCMCSGIIYPTAMSKILILFREISGSASSALSLINLIITSIISFISGLIASVNILDLYLMYFLMSIFCVLCCIDIIYNKIPYFISRNLKSF